MINKIGNKNTNNKQNNIFYEERNFFNEKFIQILENDGEVRENFLGKTKEVFIKKGIQKYINENDFYFLQKYKENENDLRKKLDKYFPIHSKIFLDLLLKDLKNIENKNSNEIKNKIKNFVKKYLYIIFIFSEKVKLSDLENFLKKDLSELSFIHMGAERDITNLENFEKDLNNRIKEKLKEKQERKEKNGEKYEFEELDEKTIKIIDEQFFSSMYRQLYREIAISNRKKEKNKGGEIAEKIEKIYPKAVEKIFYIFETWVEGGHKNDENLKHIKIIIRKLIEGVKFMKDEDIAFENFPFSNLNDKFINEFVEIYTQNIKSKNKNHFKNLIVGVFEDNIEKKEKIYENLISNLEKDDKESIISGIPEKQERLENLDTKKINFSSWLSIPENQKYEYVFSEVIANNGKIKFPDFLELENEKFLNLFTEYFFQELHNGEGNKKIFFKTYKKQIKTILKYEGETVEKFVSDDVNNLNFLILWWRFILKTRELKEQNQELNLENIYTLTEKKYGVIEKISEKLVGENILPSEKIIFSIEDKPRNTSVKTTDTLIFDLTKGLKKGFINLKEEKIKLQNGDTKLFSSFQDLYIPSGLTENKDETTDKKISKIETHLDYGIDLCFNILKGNKVTIPNEKLYLEMLIEKKFLPENIENLKTSDLENIQKLVEILKYFRTRIKHLESMLKHATKDKKKFNSIIEIKKFLQNENSDFGPDKSPDRALIKLIGEYYGNFNKLGDLIRLRIIGQDLNETINQVTEFIKISKESEYITNISIVDKIGEPISIPKEDSGYRDIKLLLKLEGGSTVEVQFQIKEMYKTKTEGIDLELEENKNIFEKMKYEESLIHKKEMLELLNIAKERNIKLPTKNILQKLMIKESGINWETFKEITTETKISTDYTYHIIRQLSKTSSIRKKLTRLERILADSTWSKEILKYLVSKDVKIN